MQNIYSWTCEQIATTTQDCIVTAYSSSTATTTDIYSGPNFQEWLFVSGIVIFFLSFMSWGRFVRIRKKQ